MEFKVVLYIVIGVGYFIYNFYKKVKTPPGDNTNYDADREGEHGSTVETESSKGNYKTIDDIINDLNNQEHVKSSKEQNYVISEGEENTEGTSVVVKNEKQELVEFKEEFEKSTLRKDDMPMASIISKRKQKSKSKVKFNLRKAVLYRAVMERPKY